MRHWKAYTALLIVLLIIAAALYLRYGGVTHAEIVRTVDDRAQEINEHIDARASAIETKLDRVEEKLDRLLKIAERPLPDGLKEVP